MTETYARPQAPWALRLLPPFPAVTHRILALASQENVSTEKLGELIRMDPSFAAELLRYANSALFGSRREVTSLGHAVNLMGLDRLKTMATFVALNNMVRTSVRVEALRKVWVHSLVTALVAGEAARGARTAEDSAYTTGLLHNLGSLGLMSAYPDEYTRMLSVSNDYGFDLMQTERDLFEIDHCAAGAFLARDWSFPGDMVEAIESHHDEPVQGEPPLNTIIQVSWRMADTLGYAAFSPDREWSHEELCGYLPSAGRSWVSESAEVARARIDELLTATPL